MKTPRLYIEDVSEAPHCAMHTKVYLLREDDNGNDEKIDISAFVSKADVKWHVGETVTATLECLVTGVKARASVEAVLVKEFLPPTKWRRRIRDVTTFGSPGWREYMWRR